MLFRFLEAFSNQPMMLMLGVVGLAMIGGGIPPIRERIRRRKIENCHLSRRYMLVAEPLEAHSQTTLE